MCAFWLHTYRSRHWDNYAANRDLTGLFWSFRSYIQYYSASRSCLYLNRGWKGYGNDATETKESRSCGRSILRRRALLLWVFRKLCWSQPPQTIYPKESNCLPCNLSSQASPLAGRRCIEHGSGLKLEEKIRIDDPCTCRGFIQNANPLVKERVPLWWAPRSREHGRVARQWSTSSIAK